MTLLLTLHAPTGCYLVSVVVGRVHSMRSISRHLLETHDAHRERAQAWAESEAARLCMREAILT